mmetsp:Transcript_5353/g.13597  ORF Transcript_5353/g.13597 Transcript_5353/m.13597 type:complete len:252 (+) Transcript_5353:199-954(+)
MSGGRAELGPAAGCQLLIVRHGERDDEVEGSTWRRDYRDRWFDPPLTQRGLEHAKEVAGELQRQLAAANPDQPDVGFDYIAVSPLLRAVQTAQAFSKAFKLPMKIVPGLSACAAAVEAEGLARHGSDLVMAKSGLRFRTPQEYRELAPLATWTDDTCDEIMGFEETVLKLCFQACAKGRRVLIVAHREGIRDLSRQYRVSTPYCCVGVFTFIRDPVTLQFQDCIDLVKFHRTGTKKHLAAQVLQPSQAVNI